MCGGGGGCGSILGTVGSVMSFIPGLQPFGMALSAGSKLLGAFGGSGNKAAAPPPVPAAPPPVPRANGGATVQIGTDTGAGRVTGVRNPNRPPSGIASTDNVLAGLGRGGLAL